MASRLNLRFIRWRFFCEDCHRAFSESLGFVDERRGYTHRYQAWIFHQVRENNIGAVHRAEGLTYDQIESIFLHEARCRIPLAPFANLKRLGIDEIALRKGRGDFALILTNLDTKEVVDVLKAHPQALQGAHYALLKNRQDLTDKQQAALEHVYQVSPLVKTAHRLKECLRHIFECKPTKEKAILGSGALLLRKRGCFHNSVGR